MAFVPGFEWDVFISYAWANNKPQELNHPETGWVHEFRQYLQDYLDEKLYVIAPDGRRQRGNARIFFDTYAVRQQIDFQKQVDGAVSTSATMLVLMSDAYLGSDACIGEITLFDTRLGGEANQSGRLMPLHLEPTQDRPPRINEVLDRVKGYDFFAVDPIERIPRRYRIESEDFIKQLEVVRARLAEQLNAMCKERVASTGKSAIVQAGLRSLAASTDTLGEIFLAEGIGPKKVREELENHFRSSRIRILPERPYGRDAADYRESLDTDLAHCSVFVQVFGSSASVRTDELPRGYEGLQLDVAREKKLPVMQWRDSKVDWTNVDEPDHAEMAKEAEYFGLPIEFAKAVVEKVARRKKSGMPAAIDGHRRIALVKRADGDEVLSQTLEDHLMNHDIMCRISSNGLKTLERLKEIPFDAVVMVYGKCKEPWIQDRADELMDVLLDRKDQSPISAFYLARSDQRPPLGAKTILKVVHQDMTALDNLVSAILSRGVAQ